MRAENEPSLSARTETWLPAAGLSISTVLYFSTALGWPRTLAVSASETCALTRLGSGAAGGVWSTTIGRVAGWETPSPYAVAETTTASPSGTLVRSSVAWYGAAVTATSWPPTANSTRCTGSDTVATTATLLPNRCPAADGFVIVTTIGLLSTVTVTAGPAVPTLPATSVARAATVCGPFAQRRRVEENAHVAEGESPAHRAVDEQLDAREARSGLDRRRVQRRPCRSRPGRSARAPPPP